MYDVTLVVAGERFPCHKCVLASLSDYFNAMFTNELAESKQSEVTMNSFEASTMKLIIDYAYTSQLNITDNNVQAVLTAANIFDIKTLKEACSRYMEWQMEESNCKSKFDICIYLSCCNNRIQLDIYAAFLNVIQI